MVLISLSAVAVVMTLPDNQQDTAKLQAQRFFYKLQLLNEDAILNGRDYGVRFDNSGDNYRFVTLTEKGWQPLENKTYKETTFEQGLSVDFQLGSDAWANNDTLFNQESLFDEEMFAELDEKTQSLPPQVFVLSSGEVTPFSVTISAESQPESLWTIEAKENGEITLVTPMEYAKRAGQ